MLSAHAHLLAVLCVAKTLLSLGSTIPVPPSILERPYETKGLQIKEGKPNIV
jgi:hypothetical protein